MLIPICDDKINDSESIETCCRAELDDAITNPASSALELQTIFVKLGRSISVSLELPLKEMLAPSERRVFTFFKRVKEIDVRF